MSQHIIIDTEKKYVFGWDHPLQSFYLQVHDLKLPEDSEENPVVWLGATKDTIMYEVDDLVRAARREGLEILRPLRGDLYGEKDDGV